MPTYSYKNKNTGEEVDTQMSISDMEKFEVDNPHLERIYKSLNIADPINIGVKRPPADFQKYVLGRIKDKPGVNKSLIEKRWDIKKEI
jgi:hypothetical protein